MAEPFMAEIRLMSFAFAPKTWALCNGQLMPINQNQALFSLLGTTYGGNGQTNFALPDFRGRTPIHVGSGHVLGEQAGEQAHTLSTAELPTHLHMAQGTSNQASLGASGGGVWATQSTNPYAAPADLVAMSPAAIGTTGNSQAHVNMQPFLTLTFCICLVGIFPSPN